MALGNAAPARRGAIPSTLGSVPYTLGSEPYTLCSLFYILYLAFDHLLDDGVLVGLEVRGQRREFWRPWLKSPFSISLICITPRRTPASPSAN